MSSIEHFKRLQDEMQSQIKTSDIVIESLELEKMASRKGYDALVVTLTDKRIIKCVVPRIWFRRDYDGDSFKAIARALANEVQTRSIK